MMTERKSEELLLEAFAYVSTKALADAYLDISRVIDDTPDSKLKNLCEIQLALAKCLARHISGQAWR